MKWLLLVFVVLGACSPGAKNSMEVTRVAPGATLPDPTPTQSERTSPLAIQIAGDYPATVRRIVPASTSSRIPLEAANSVSRIGIVDNIAVFLSASARTPVLNAVDLTSGRRLWSAPHNFSGPYIMGTRTIFAANAPGGNGMTAIDFKTGEVLWKRSNLRPIGFSHGVVFGQIGMAFAALAPRTGKTLWTALLGGGAAPESFHTVGRRVLVSAGESGAILVEHTYVFDLSKGKFLRDFTYASSTVLDIRGDHLYLLTMWPGDLDFYRPATINNVDLATGKATDRTYAPDASENMSGNNPWTGRAFVSGNYVYFEVAGKAYRYDLDTDPQSAHPTRMPQKLQAYTLHGNDAWSLKNGKLRVLSMDSPSIAREHRFDPALPSISNFRIDGSLAYAAANGHGVYVIDADTKAIRLLARSSCPNILSVERNRDQLYVFCRGPGGNATALTYAL